MKKSKKLKIIPLGGLGEIGKNMTVFEYDNDIIVVDAGLKFPEDEMLGIDIVIPDITYLEKNQEKIRGIIYTHGHEDHIGATPYVLKKFDVPLFGTKLTLNLIINKLVEHKDLKKPKMHFKNPGDRFRLGHFDIEMIHVSHSIPDAVALAIRTPVGNVLHTGDFKIDYTPIDGKVMDLSRFAQIGREGVDLLMADSTNVEREGHTMSESSVGETFEKIFRHAQGRIVVASFSSNVHRIQQVVNAAVLENRKVAISGRSMENVTGVAIELGYLKLPKGTTIDIQDIDRYPDNEVAVITTGSQGEPMSALTRMANKSHRFINIRENDTIVLSSSPIPGNEKSVKNIINKLLETGAEVIYTSLADVHVSGHACKEELKLVHSLVNARSFMPVHGEYSHLKHHSDLAKDLGMSNKNIFILENGDSLELDKEGVHPGPKVDSGHVLIDGLGIGDVGNIVLRDRRILSEEGLIIVVVALEKATGKMKSGPDIVSRGFVYVRESEDMIQSAVQVAKKAMEKCDQKNIREWNQIKNALRDDLKEYFWQQTKRRPMILPIIMDV
ncbi:MAG: ribonuclease J [delta proteobacterium ML8_F1]|nr:MAG: ribonuclease J [delta proteobacterium ML8_F1]